MDFPFPLTPQEAGQGKMISYVSIQPGAGASTLACLHASCMSPEEVALADFSPAAKVRAYLGLTEDVSAASILGIKNIVDAKEIYHASEKKDDIFVFPGVARIINLPQINTQLHLNAVMSFKKMFKYSINVLGGLTGPSWITAMLSDIICLVVSPRRPDMDSFRENMEFLSRLGCGSRIRIILNQSGMPQGIKPEDCKGFFQPDFTIQYDEKIIRAGNIRNLAQRSLHNKVFEKITATITNEVDSQDQMLIGTLAARDGLISSNNITDMTTSEEKEKEIKNIIPAETYKQLRGRVQTVVREQFSWDELDPVQARNPVTRAKFNEIVAGNLEISIPEPEIPLLANRLFNDILGYGPLENYFMDQEVTEIKVNGTKIRVEKKGIETQVNEEFESIEQAVDLLRRMVSHTGRRIDQAEPRVKARLHDGSRLMGQIAPVAVDGVLISIRRFRQDIDISALIANKAASPEVIDFLRVAVEMQMNIIAAGGTGAGKTTWLNTLASFIPHDQSIITIEDPAELDLQHPDVRRLESRPANIEGKGQVTIADLVQDSLRMAPKRIIVGECRGEETIQMLQAMNTGHDGSMTTLHSSSAEHGAIRIVNMVEQAGMSIPHDAIMDQINDVIDLILYVKRDRKTKARRLDHIIEIAGVHKAEDGRTVEVLTNRLWQYNPVTETWDWVAKDFKLADKFAQGGWQW